MGAGDTKLWHALMQALSLVMFAWALSLMFLAFFVPALLQIT